MLKNLIRFTISKIKYSYNFIICILNTQVIWFLKKIKKYKVNLKLNLFKNPNCMLLVKNFTNLKKLTSLVTLPTSVAQLVYKNMNKINSIYLSIISVVIIPFIYQFKLIILVNSLTVYINIFLIYLIIRAVLITLNSNIIITKKNNYLIKKKFIYLI